MQGGYRHPGFVIFHVKGTRTFTGLSPASPVYSKAIATRRSIIIRKGIHLSETGIISPILQKKKLRLHEACPNPHDYSAATLGSGKGTAPGVRNVSSRVDQGHSSSSASSGVPVGLPQRACLRRYSILKIATSSWSLLPP